MIREIFFAGFALAMVNTALASDNDGIRAQYHGSPELPDGIAFEQFLALVGTAGHDHNMALEHVAKALGISLDKPGQRLARERADYFIEIRRQLIEEQAHMRELVLCIPGYGNRSADELHEVLNDLDDLKEIVATKYYRLSLVGLTGDERIMFDAYLQQKKLAITYVKTDSRHDGREMESMTFRIDHRCKNPEASHD